MLQCCQQEIKRVFLSEFEPSIQQVNKIDLYDTRMFCNTRTLYYNLFNDDNCYTHIK